MGASRRALKRRRKTVMGSHQRCWVWGRHAVTEILAAGRWPVLELHAADDWPAEDAQCLRQLAASRGVDLTVEPTEQLTRRCGSREHQGLIAKMPPFPYDDAETLLAAAPADPAFAILDGLHDPFNFGAVLRSAEVFGLDGVFVGQSRQAEVNSLVARSSAGAVNHVRIAQVPDLMEWGQELQSRGVRLVAASEKAERTLDQTDLRGPTALVLGNEGHGIQAELLKLCDERVRIPQCGRVGSLNVAVAAGVLFYETRRQRGESAPRTA